MMVRTIFVADNEENTRMVIKKYLAREGFCVETYSSAEELVARLQTAFPDMFILDIILCGTEDLEFYYDIRKRSGLPVIVIFPGDEEADNDLKANLSGCEYLTRPLGPRELVAKVRSILRHSSFPANQEEILERGNLRVDPNNRHTTVDTTEVMLTPQEYELLLLLARQPQRTFTRQEILDRIWGYDYVGEIRAVDNLVKRLRKKLRESGSAKNVKTVWGWGYRFDE